ncbi:MAG: 5-(carboxyamino)imidazole ribonucleotide synthase [Isosphaeraceae bacterium]|nr:5-(carboxyamino)imidazole ribonucleotide synthase [Isosphaeraceae bacterium]
MNRLEPLHPPAKIGVIGGGQLGRMFLSAAHSLGYDAGVLCETDDCPAAQVASWKVVGASDDLDSVRRFAEQAQAVTVEFENVSAAALRRLARSMPVRPGWRTVRVSQNRIREKRFLESHGFPVAPWAEVRSEADLAGAIARIGSQIVLKTAETGYDGKGQVRVHSEREAIEAWRSLGSVACVAEGWVEFAHEVSVVSVRGADSQAATYPVGLNRHSRHILDTTVMPAPVGPVIALEASSLALAISAALETVGVLTVEFFLTKEGRLIVNELAPRPHNSGHLTIEAAATSQFEQQVRALCGLPLGSTSLGKPAAMANLLGDLWVNGPPDWSAALRGDPALKIHLYGKRSASPGRKMGHMTVIDDDPETALARVLEARRRLNSSA